MENRGYKITAGIVVAVAGLMMSSGGVDVPQGFKSSPPTQSSDTSRRGIADGDQMQAQGKDSLAKKVLQIGVSGSMKEARYNESKKGGGQQVDRNSGNPFPANTAYHSFVRSTCLEWEDPEVASKCKKGRELDPYITPHGLGEKNSDASGLEALIVKAYENAKDKNQGTSGEYKIWDVEARNGEEFVQDGVFKSDRVKSWKIKDQLQQQIADVGYKTAMQETIQVKDLGKGFNVAAPPEVLRTMASRYTKILRNRMVTNLGESRASQPGTEVLLNEDVWNPKEYARAVAETPADGMYNRRQNQFEFDDRENTETLSMEERVANAEKLKEASVRMANATIEGDKVVAGDPNKEAYDAAASRLNIALIDRVGADPNEMVKPSDVNFDKKDLAPLVGEYSQNGERNLVNAKNVDQLESYNEQLRESARGMAQAAAKFPGSTPYTEETIKDTLAYQIQPGTKNAVVINGRTKAMDEDLMGTQVPRLGTPENQTIERNLEVRPSQLTFSAAQ